MFCGSMIGGTLYGTGRKFAHLTADQRVIAMKVGDLISKVSCETCLTLSLVLVAL